MDSGAGRSAVDGGLRRRVPLPDLALAAALTALLLPVTARTVWGGSWPVGLQWTVLGALAVAHAALALRRRAPLVVFAVAGGLVLLLTAAPALDPASGRTGPFAAVLVPSVLVFPVALYTVAAWCPPRTSLLALAASCLGGVLVVVRLWGADYLTVAQPGLVDDPVRSWPLFLAVAVLAVVLLPWWAGRYRRLRLLYAADQARRAVDDERRRIAREVHDVVAHSLSVMVTQAEGGRAVAARDPAATVPVLETIARTGREAMEDMASVLQVLHRPAGPGGAPEPRQPGLADLPALVEQVRGSGLPVRLEECGPRRPLSAASGLAVYRVVQEALTNVLKHAGPRTPTQVALTWGDAWLEVAVDNEAAGSATAAAGSGRGLAGMEERVTALGGSFTVVDADGRFGVRARIPVTGRGRP